MGVRGGDGAMPVLTLSKLKQHTEYGSSRNTRSDVRNMLLLLSAASASLHEQHPLVPAGTAPQPSWDREPNVRCDHPVTDVVGDAPNADACAKACTSTTLVRRGGAQRDMHSP